MSTNGKPQDKLVNLMGRFVSIPVSVLEMVGRGEISPTDFTVWCFLMKYTTFQDGKDFAMPKYETIMEGTGIKGRTTLSNALKGLEEAGILQKRRRFGNSTVYTLVPPPVEMPETANSPETGR